MCKHWHAHAGHAGSGGVWCIILSLLVQFLLLVFLTFATTEQAKIISTWLGRTSWLTLPRVVSCSSTAVEVAVTWVAPCGQQPRSLYGNSCLVQHLVSVPLLQAVQSLWEGITVKLIGKHAVSLNDPWQIFSSIDTDISYIMPWGKKAKFWSGILDIRLESVLTKSANCSPSMRKCMLMVWFYATVLIWF